MAFSKGSLMSPEEAIKTLNATDWKIYFAGYAAGNNEAWEDCAKMHTKIKVGESDLKSAPRARDRIGVENPRSPTM